MQSHVGKNGCTEVAAVPSAEFCTAKHAPGAIDHSIHGHIRAQAEASMDEHREREWQTLMCRWSAKLSACASCTCPDEAQLQAAEAGSRKFDAAAHRFDQFARDGQAQAAAST